jgi:hypothetical protein
MNYKYRKRPIIIEAIQMTKDRYPNKDDWPSWLHEAWEKETIQFEDDCLIVWTLEGCKNVSVDDWIIKGIIDELYPCKPGVFKDVYDPMIEF